MAKYLYFLVLCSFIVGVGCSGAGIGNVPLKTDKQKSSYSIGQQIGRGIKAQGMDLDVKVMAMAIQDVLDGKKSRLEQKDMQVSMQNMRKSAAEKKRKEGEANKVIGQTFLKKNKKAKGVKITKSGLQYQVIKEGKGKKPKDSDRVKVHYKGTLIDGTEFDSSYERKKPSEFRVRGVIKGWTEALLLMNTGAKWKLFIPSELAYGSRARPKIPANSVLIFEIELLEIKT